MNSATEVRLAPAMPRPSPPPLVIGVGSPHGEDRAGWEVVDRLGAMDLNCSPACFHKAAVPHDALDWFDPHTTTHVVDAMASRSDRLLRFEIVCSPLGELQTLLTDQANSQQSVAFPALRSHSTHQFDLRSVLELAATLNLLPHSVVLWAIPIEGIDTPQGTLGWSMSNTGAEKLAALPNATLERHIRHAVQCIANEITHA